MRINAINNARQNVQNFKGIRILNSADKEAVNKMLDGKGDIFEKATEAKDIDIFLFGSITDAEGRKVPAYAGIVQNKKSRFHQDGKQRAVATFKCPATEEGLEEAREKLEKAVVWANAPANMLAGGSIERIGKDKDHREYIKDLQEKMNNAYFTNEAKVWEQKLDIILTRDSKM